MGTYAVATAVIVACLVGIAAVVVRKFPQLSLIDTSALPLERDARKKKAIINDRASRMTAAFGRRIAATLTRGFERLRERFRSAYRKVLALERQYRKEKPVPAAQADAKIAVLAADAERLRKAGEYGDAEKRYIEILSIDRKNADAYWGLGGLYSDAKRYDQAKETFAYLVRMIRKDSRCLHGEDGSAVEGRPCAAGSSAHADIAAGWLESGLAAIAAGNRAEARIALERAAAFEPANPRHLDLLLDACILEGDKSRASEVFAQLKAANPENNKLDSFAERIASIPVAPPPPKGKTRAAPPGPAPF
jgi:tetratricopeptide (TPR) repeat protein